uniref:Uncharacterized protein n=1 Tax=Lotus japonicus TaxID=34305 RepID=I3SM31_LOTJA|nr:unknown [Lotus japonicus]
MYIVVANPSTVCMVHYKCRQTNVAMSGFQWRME